VWRHPTSLDPFARNQIHEPAPSNPIFTLQGELEMALLDELLSAGPVMSPEEAQSREVAELRMRCALMFAGGGGAGVWRGAWNTLHTTERVF